MLPVFRVTAFVINGALCGRRCKVSSHWRVYKPLNANLNGALYCSRLYKTTEQLFGGVSDVTPFHSIKRFESGPHVRPRWNSANSCRRTKYGRRSDAGRFE